MKTTQCSLSFILICGTYTLIKMRTIPIVNTKIKCFGSCPSRPKYKSSPVMKQKENHSYNYILYITDNCHRKV